MTSGFLNQTSARYGFETISSSLSSHSFFLLSSSSFWHFSLSIYQSCSSSSHEPLQSQAAMTVKGGTSQACAACKYQRRKCVADCALAPYFKPDQQKIFQNAHKLFGVSNILKILKQVDPTQKSDAMRSIIYESNIREKYPVHGCCCVISDLQFQIQQALLELEAVNEQIVHYRQQYPQLQLGTGPSNNALQLFQPHAAYLQFNNNMETVTSPGSHNSFSNGNNNNNNAVVFKTDDYMESKDNLMNQYLGQTPYINNSNNSMGIQSQMINTQAFPIQQVPEAPQGYDEMAMPMMYFDPIDDRQSYIESKDPYESSSDSSLKDTRESIEHVSETELKNAAARLTLTSV